MAGEKKWQVYGTVIGAKYIGEYEAETAQEAINKACRDADISLCYQCDRQFYDHLGFDDFWVDDQAETDYEDEGSCEGDD